MNNPFAKESNAILQVLKDAYSKLELIQMHPDAVWLKQKTMMDMKRNIAALSIQLGIDLPDDENNEVVDHSQPIKKLFGKVIGEKPAKIESITNSDEINEVEMGEKAKELYNRFILASVEDIISTISVEDIYAVADLAGVDYDVIPEQAKPDFVESIKQAIKEKQLPASGSENDGGKKEDPAITELRNKRDALYDKFNDMEMDQILDKIPDIEVRAVAKKAGLPVTDVNPKKIDQKFVNQIKEAIKKQKAIDA